MAQVDDIGLPIEVSIRRDGAPYNLTGFSTLELILKKPDGVVVGPVAAVAKNPPGTDGIARYLTTASVLDTAGFWKVQAHVVSGAEDFRTGVGDFEVEANL